MDLFTYADSHPAYGELAVMPKGGCPLFLRPDYVIVAGG